MSAFDRRKRTIADRAFTWYWSLRARRARDMRAFRRLVLRRRAELDRLAARAERLLARDDRVAAPDAVWSISPALLGEPSPQTAWRDPETGLNPARDLTLFHDAEGGGFTLAQRPAQGGPRRFELFFESYEFAGSYLSLAVGVPHDLRRPKTGEMLRVRLDLTASRPIKTFLRLNISSTRMTDTLHDDRVLGDGAAEVCFDLSFAAQEAQEGDQIWLDLIFDRPRMMEFALRDLSLDLVSAGS